MPFEELFSWTLHTAPDKNKGQDVFLEAPVLPANHSRPSPCSPGFLSQPAGHCRSAGSRWDLYVRMLLSSLTASLSSCQSSRGQHINGQRELCVGLWVGALMKWKHVRVHI